MRLLELSEDGKFSLTRDLINNIPTYAILSHTWGDDEVTFKDMEEGSADAKAGYQKIRFCGEQAARDNLRYFWVDTCCIDKSNSVEFSEAINSMFRWYQKAEKCYVYLPDVSALAMDVLHAFRKSRWFSRGWTLHELIAPGSVEFFSQEGEKLGNKRSIEQHICEITGISAKALRGSSLSKFSLTERLSWAKMRQTTREEDMAYSLLGIFGISMPLIYGEGKERGLRRLREEIDKSSKGINHEDFSVSFSLSNAANNEYFVARENEIIEIQKELSSDGSRRTVVLQGLGGIGKTQLAVAYMKRHKDNYSAIFWLNIKDENSLRQSFANIARQILRDHPLASQLNRINMKGNLDDVVDGVKAWLSLPNNTRWLLIYDNYDNPRLPGNTDPAAVDIRHFLPESYQGSVIVTTRSSQVKIGHQIQIRKLENMQDSLHILSHASRREGLTEHSIPHGNFHDHVKRQNPLSAKLLLLWAYFDGQDLWFELLHDHTKDQYSTWIQELTQDEFAFHDAVRVLSDHGLVEKEMSSQERIESRGYSIHACVHSWTVHVLNQELDSALATIALACIANHLSGEHTSKPWAMRRRIRQHVARCSDLVSKGIVAGDEMGWAYYKIGYFYLDHDELRQSELMHMLALERLKNTCAEDIIVFDAIENLGTIYKKQGKLAAAELMYSRALLGKQKVSAANIGVLYMKQGKFNAAERMLKQTIRSFKRAAASTEKISIVQANLGGLYRAQGKLDKAADMYELALQGFEQAFGADNILTHLAALQTFEKFGILFEEQSDLEGARIMYSKAFAGYETVFGLDHVQTRKIQGYIQNLDKYIGQKAMEQAERSKTHPQEDAEDVGPGLCNLLIKLNVE